LRATEGAGEMRGKQVVVVAGIMAALVGCSSAQRPDVERSAVEFVTAVARGDTGTGCDLLAPATRLAVEHDEGLPCAAALAGMGLPGGAVRSTEVWGGAARVALSGDTLFLTETDSGWRISAAGCRSRGDAPYTCLLEAP
jgi:hypothetical protein